MAHNNASSSDGESKTPEANWGKFTKDFEANEEWWKRYEKEFWEKYEKTVNEQTTKEPEDIGFKKKRKEIDLGVKVDESLCIGCCSCEMIAPEVFTINKNTKSNPTSLQNGSQNQPKNHQQSITKSIKNHTRFFIGF